MNLQRLDAILAVYETLAGGESLEGHLSQMEISLRTLAVSAISAAAGQGARDEARTSGAVGMVWIAEGDACVDCAALSGETSGLDPSFDPAITWGDQPNTWDGFDGGPPRHPNCFPAGVSTAGPRPLAATTRWWDGELIEITIASGVVLPVTSNHPILTPEGWVAAGLLDEGSNVIRRGPGESFLAHPDDQQIPVPIEDVVDALRGSSRVPPVRVPSSPVDFHGDGGYGEVEIVRADGFLSHHGKVSEPDEHLTLVLAVDDLPLFDRQRLLVAMGLRQGATASGGMSGSDLTGSLIRGHPGPLDRFCLASPSRPDTRLIQDPVDRSPGDPVGIREALDALTRGVSSDQIIKIRRYPWSGHVFNLETSEGWYFVNDIVVHNCRCRVDPWYGEPGFPEALQRESERGVLYGWSLPSESAPLRLRAVSRLLSRGGTRVPKTVERYARAALREGKFPAGRTLP